MLDKIYHLIPDNITEFILFMTLLAIIWYSLETRWLRKWQKRSVQMSILELITDINKWNKESLRTGFGHTAYPTSNLGETLRKIYEDGELDLSDIYKWSQKKIGVWEKLKKLFKSRFKI